MKTLSVQELKDRKQRGENFPLINTLSAEDFGKTKIPDSTNVPLESGDFVSRVEAAAGGKDQPVVVYCASEECQSSTKAAKKLEEAGFTEVYDFEGGAKAWREAGEPLAAQV